MNILIGKLILKLNVGLLDEKSGLKPQARHQIKIWKRHEKKKKIKSAVRSRL